MNYLHLVFLTLCLITSGVYARHYTLQEIFSYWPELNDFQTGIHSFAFDPSEYIFTVDGDKYHLDYLDFDQKKNRTTLSAFVSELGIQIQDPVIVKALNVPCYAYMFLNSEASLTYCFRPEENVGNWTQQAPQIPFSKTIDAISSTAEFISSEYVYHAPDEEYRYVVKTDEGIYLELRLVQFFGSPGLNFKDVMSWVNLWDARTVTQPYPFGELEVFICPSVFGPNPANQCDLLKQLGVQIMITVREHSVLPNNN